MPGQWAVVCLQTMRGGKNGADTEWADAFQVPQEAAGVCGGLGFKDADENPPCGPINRHEEVAPQGFIGHFRKVFHVDMDVSRLGRLEGALLRLLILGREIEQVANPVPTQAAVKAGAGNVRVQKLAHHSQQVIERHQQRRAQRHRNGLLGRGQRRLQAVRRVAAVVNAIAVFPFIHRLLVCRENDRMDRFLTLQTAEAFRQGRCRLVARLDCRPYLRRRRRLAMKMSAVLNRRIPKSRDFA